MVLEYILHQGDDLMSMSNVVSVHLFSVYSFSISLINFVQLSHHENSTGLKFFQIFSLEMTKVHLCYFEI